MKKVLRYLLMTVMAICFSIPCFGAAEAASVALLPLINNVEGGDELANQVFYKNALAVLNSKKGFVVVENDKLTAVINDAKIGNKVPSAATLEKIAKDGDVDIVIAVQLDKLDDKAMDHIEAIIYSMTPAERAKPEIINPKRKRRIAAGSGRTVEEVNRLLRQYETMQKLMKKARRNPKGFMRSLSGLTGRKGF